MQVHRNPARHDVSKARAVDPKTAAEQRLNECGYLVGRYHCPASQVEKIAESMDLASRTLLAIEMNERAQDSWRADYDPFRETV